MKINPWTAKALTDATKDEKFKSVMNLAAERVILGRSAIIVGWVIGGFGGAAFLAAIFMVVMLMPLKETRFVFEEIDKSTGIIGQPVALADAPKLFGQVVDMQYLRRYIEVMEGWVPELDEQNDHVVKIMSTPDQQARIADARNSPTSPVKALAKDGHIQIENFRFHQLASAKDGITRSYLVQFDRTVWRGQSKEPMQRWSATIDFQWHPAFLMTPDDRTVNPGGFQAIAYSARSDSGDNKRQ
jgi:type IV secretory pathway component VirB8